MTSEEIEEKSGDVFDDRCVERVDQLLPPALAANEVGGLQHIEMMGQRSLRHRETFGELSGASGALMEELQDPPAARIRDRLEDFLDEHRFDILTNIKIKSRRIISFIYSSLRYR